MVMMVPYFSNNMARRQHPARKSFLLALAVAAMFVLRCSPWLAARNKNGFASFVGGLDGGAQHRGMVRQACMESRAASVMATTASADAKGAAPPASRHCLTGWFGVLAATVGLLVAMAPVNVQVASAKMLTLDNTANDYDGYDFNVSKMDDLLTKSYDKVKPICKEMKMVVGSGARTESEIIATRVKCTLPKEAQDKVDAEKAAKEAAGKK
mmetsp:Transcript_9869/g.25987  ORF Transcript_9869/g.25987 Transcript_9869/m.25987 type:complete len:211 (+) Transcript_9869:101-733(+)